MRSRRDGGTVIPLILLSVLLAGLLVTAGTAASAAFLAQRDLAGVCDGAALAGAAAVDRAAVDRAAVDPERAVPDGTVPDPAVPHPAVQEPAVPHSAVQEPAVPDPAGAVDRALPLDPRAVTVATERYRARAGKPGLALRAGTDGHTVTVVCRRTVRIPFGAVLGRAGGLERTAVARARSAVLPRADRPST
jgi:hypothetical protein